MLTAAPIYWQDFGFSSVALELGPLLIRWYSLAYIAGILLGWRYMLALIAQPNAPLARRHADDMVFNVTLGILIGGRLGYTIFYAPEIWQNPLDVLKLWEGGMSFHGGALGVLVAIVWMSMREKLNLIRLGDYLVCCVPFGLFFGRIANFVNGELWGRVTDVPWAMVFPDAPDGMPRHPSQIYEAGLEGLGLGLVLAFAFWRTDARTRPGLLSGLFLVGYGLSRFAVEYVREPDAALGVLGWGLTMGQTLTLPMLIGGVWLIATANRRAVAA